MVKPASRPASLTQRHVDDLARGRHEEASRLLRVARHTLPESEKQAARSAPVEVATKEMQAISRTGTAPTRVLQRIGAATPIAAAPAKSKTKAGRGKPTGSSPTRKPTH